MIIKETGARKEVKPIEVNITSNGCWECVSHAKDSVGYCIITRNGIRTSVHRYVYSLYNGKIPPGMCILHSCDNRCCCNPEHLSIGTHKENMEDMHKKGRSNHYNKFAEYEKNIINDYQLGIKIKDIMDKYNISRRNIYTILERNNIKTNRNK